MSDLISRNALKEEIVKLCERINANNGVTVPTLAFTRIIDNTHWVDNHNGTISCSHCRTWFYKDDRYSYMRYCPYCNVKMKGGAE